jgi:hypothetical protein
MGVENMLQQLLQAGRIWRLDHQELGPALAGSITKQHSHLTATSLGCPQFDLCFPAGPFALGACHEFIAETAPLTIFSHLVGNTIRGSVTHHNEQYSSNNTPPKLIIWIGSDVWPTPAVLDRCLYKRDPKNGSTYSLLSQCLFVEAKTQKEKLWCLQTALRSSATAAVVCALPSLHISLSRKISLAARNSNCLGLITVSPKSSMTSSSMQSRWKVEPTLSTQAAGSLCFNLELLHYKGMQPKARLWKLEFFEESPLYEHYNQTLSVRAFPTMGNQFETTSPGQRQTSLINQQKRA